MMTISSIKLTHLHTHQHGHHHQQPTLLQYLPLVLCILQIFTVACSGSDTTSDITDTSFVEVQTTVGEASYPEPSVSFPFSEPSLMRGVQLFSGATWQEGSPPFSGLIAMVSGGFAQMPTRQYGGNKWSIRLWANCDLDSNDQNWARFIDLSNGPGKDGIAISRMAKSDRISLIFIQNGNRDQVDSNPVIKRQSWMDITVTYSFPTAVIYVNGTEVGRKTMSVQPVEIARQYNYLGKSAYRADSPFAGKIDKVQVWTNYALSSSQVKDIFTEDLKKPCSIKNGGCDFLTACVPNVLNPWDTPTCTNCPDGYANVGNGGISVCVDVDECVVMPQVCSEKSRCLNKIGSYECTGCPTGYEGDGKGSNGCRDIDECAIANGGCSIKQRCFNTPGGYTCGACPAGYLTIGKMCQDINECTVNNGGCNPLTRCINIEGSRKCTDCPSGYTGSGATYCRDEDECERENGRCDSRTSCINTPGSRECSKCPLGYKGSGESGCIDVDECASNKGGCDPHTDCINTPGSRNCGPCPTDWEGNGQDGCSPPDPCKRNNGGCHELTRCIRTVDSRICGDCPAGYKGNGLNGCVSIDVCRVVDNGGCDSKTRCIPDSDGQITAKGRRCGPCPAGMIGDGETGCRDDLRYLAMLKPAASSSSNTMDEASAQELRQLNDNIAVMTDYVAQKAVTEVLNKLVGLQDDSSIKQAMNQIVSSAQNTPIITQAQADTRTQTVINDVQKRQGTLNQQVDAMRLSKDTIDQQHATSEQMARTVRNKARQANAATLKLAVKEAMNVLQPVMATKK